MKRIQDDYIYFTVPGGVTGYHYDYVNKIIDEYNKLYYKYGSFIDYFNYCLQEQVTTERVYNFSGLWNEHRTSIEKMHTIKDCEMKEG